MFQLPPFDRVGPLLAAALVAFAGVMVPALLGSSATAGTLDDFRDSVDRDQRDDDRSPPSRDDRDDRPARHHHHHSDGEVSAFGQIFGWMIVGHTPGNAFSWGDTPYDGRGSTSGGHRWVASGTDLSVAALAPTRSGHFRGRLETLALTDGSAMGFGTFLLLESNRTPGLAVWHQQFMDFGASDRMGVTTVTIEPRIVTDAVATLSWNLGGAVYGSENGILNAGAQIGLGLQLTPFQPLAFEARFAGQVLSGAQVADAYFSVGLEVAPGMFATLGYRGLLNGEASVHAGTLGLQFDLGFGGRRSETRLAAAP